MRASGTAERKQRREGRGLLGRLARDRRGNTLAMMAALLIPLIGMVGSGVDMARAYMAKAKLQTACDSAATAARRVMGASAFTTAARDEGIRFFNFNFPTGLMNTPAVTLSVAASATDASVVEVNASTTVPTEIMGIFGATGIPIAVKCSADKDYVNNDIMLVLDVTGSMNCTAGTDCDYAATEQSNSRISRLRSAAVELYRALDDATGVRTRYGFLPYSMTVNVGRDMQPAWLTPTATYHKRTCNVTYAGSGYPDLCQTWGSGWTTQTVTRTTAQLQTLIGTAAGFCLEERSSVDQSGTGTGITITTGVSQADIDTVGGAARYQWQPYDPGQAYQTGMPFNGNGTSFEQGYYANLARFCPKPAQRLTTYSTEATFQSALLAAVGTAGVTGAVGGYTNHDLGITWGMRYLSGTGMFASANPDTYDATVDGTVNPVRVDRHIVFLTDGEMTADTANYSAYGIPDARSRLSGTGDEVAKHRARFLSACSRARQMGMTVWVIVLDVTDPSQVRPCAADDSHFFVSNGSDLDSVFQLIGRGIGKLRLTE
jgi:Flp pilus assembly protein TadG